MGMTDHSHDALMEENRLGWDRVAPIHARGSGAPFYRMEQFLAGETKLAPWVWKFRGGPGPLPGQLHPENAPNGVDAPPPPNHPQNRATLRPAQG